MLVEDTYITTSRWTLPAYRAALGMDVPFSHSRLKAASSAVGTGVGVALGVTLGVGIAEGVAAGVGVGAASGVDEAVSEGVTAADADADAFVDIEQAVADEARTSTISTNPTSEPTQG